MESFRKRLQRSLPPPPTPRKPLQGILNLMPHTPQSPGRGVIYFGSARPGLDHPHYMKALNLSREIANLLHCTSWTEAGPGLMDAAIRGAMEAGKTVGGFKIEKEAGQWSSTGSHPYLPP